MSNETNEHGTRPALAHGLASIAPSRPDLAAEVISRRVDTEAEGLHGGRVLVPIGSGDLDATQDYNYTEEIDVDDVTIDYGPAAPAALTAAAEAVVDVGIASSLGLTIPTALERAFAGTEPVPLPAPPGLRPGIAASSGAAARSAATRLSGAAADRAVPAPVLPLRGRDGGDADRSRSRIVEAPADVVAEALDPLALGIEQVMDLEEMNERMCEHEARLEHRLQVALMAETAAMTSAAAWAGTPVSS